MFGRRAQFSKDRITDPTTGVTVPVVLNPRMEIADPQLPSRDRIAQYVKFIKEQGTQYCLFTPSGLKVSRNAGVCLSSQIEKIAIDYQLEDESVIAQFGDVYYYANLSSGFVIREVLVKVEEFDYQDLGGADVVALFGVNGAKEMGVQTIEARLLLTGRGVAKAHFFQPEIAAFRSAGYRHPAQVKRWLGAAIVLLAAGVAWYAYHSYQERQRYLEQQRRAAVIPPKIGKDSSVEQLRAYASWLSDYLAFYRANGLQSVEITSNQITLRGRVQPERLVHLYEFFKQQKIVPAIQLQLLTKGEAESDLVSQSTWQASVTLDRAIVDVDQFGLEIYENYLVALQLAMARLGVRVSSQTPSVNSYGIKEGQLQLDGVYDSPRILMELANVFIGIPSYAESLTLNFAAGAEALFELQFRIVGRE